jgi:hypothetical protein
MERANGFHDTCKRFSFFVQTARTPVVVHLRRTGLENTPFALIVWRFQ